MVISESPIVSILVFNIQVSDKTHKELTDCEDSFKSLFSTGVSEHYDKLALSSAFIETF